MSDPIPFPSPAASDDEKLARLKTKAEALAHKPEFEVKFFLAKHAADVGVSPEQLEAAVNEVRKLRRKDAQAQSDREKVEARNARRRESKEKSRASLFRRLKGLPDVRRRTEIEQWCRQWSEDTEVVAIEFMEYAREGAPLRPGISEEMAAGPVNGPDLVEMILRRIRQYCVLTPEVETAGTFWSLLTFVPAEVALNAPIFTAYGPKHDAGKTQFLEVLSWMSRIRDPRQGPDIILSPSAGIYRIMDLGPTLFVEEGQKIYQRDNVQEIFDASWSFGKLIWRIVNGVSTSFRPFCQKAVAMIGDHNVPSGATRRPGYRSSDRTGLAAPSVPRHVICIAMIWYLITPARTPQI